MESAASLSTALPSTSSAFVADTPKKNVVVLKTRIDGPLGAEQTIYLCGTSHVSLKACEDVRELIQAVKPEVVMLELCEERLSLLRPVTKTEAVSLGQHLQLWRDGQQPLLAVLYSWMLASVAQKCEVDPGEEFRIALHEAQSIGSSVSLGDRLVSTTIARTWAALTRWQKMRLIFDILISGMFGSKDEAALLDSLTEDEDALTAMLKEFGKEYPGLLRPLIEERDEYMVWSLRVLASQASKIVAVVGAGHLKGIQEKWDSDIDIEAITALPPQKPKQSWTHIVLIGSVGATAVASVIFAIRWRKLQ